MSETPTAEDFRRLEARLEKLEQFLASHTHLYLGPTLVGGTATNRTGPAEDPLEVGQSNHG